MTFIMNLFLNIRFKVNIISFIMLILFDSRLVVSQDKFEWFRCDSCRATFYQIGERIKNQTRVLKDYEFLEMLEDTCETQFTNRKYGVKQYEEKNYLFGPGIIDHLGDDKGFGQMGMGDYPERLKSYCHMFIEKVGEETLRKLGTEVDKEKLCKVECKSSSSGASDPEDPEKYSKKKTKKISSSSESTTVTVSSTKASSDLDKGKSSESKVTASRSSDQKSSKLGSDSESDTITTANPKSVVKSEKTANLKDVLHQISSLEEPISLKRVINAATEKLWKIASKKSQGSDSSDSESNSSDRIQDEL